MKSTLLLLFVAVFFSLNCNAAPKKKEGKEPKIAVLDNVAQFREYSAWRGAIERSSLADAAATR